MLGTPSLTWDSPGPVSSQFMLDYSFVRGLRGPFGSGKSVTCCVEVLRRAMAQQPDRQGIRPTRWAAVRNTNPELRTTTIKTWREWIGDEWGQFRWAPPYTHHLKFPLPDSTVVPAITTGGTDAKFFRWKGIPAYGFGLHALRIPYTEYPVMFHGNNERVDTESLKLSAMMWEALAREFLG